MADEWIEAQIKREAEELANVPSIPVGHLQPQASGMAGRCGWCGRYSDNVVLVEVLGAGRERVDRYKGECCGARHANGVPTEIGGVR